MPYTGPNDDKLPDNIKALSEDKRAQWVAVWNNVFEECEGDDCEGRAFTAANTVIRAVPDKYAHIDFAPGAGVHEAAERALGWIAEGLAGEGFTDVGRQRAANLASADYEPSPEIVRRMKAYFDRHEVDKDAEGFTSGEDGFPTPGRVAWDAWGGDAGQSFANRVVEQMNAADESERMLGLPETMLSQSTANYTSVSPIPTQRCENCRYFVVSGGQYCEIVEAKPEPIVFEAWCLLWQHEKYLGEIKDYRGDEPMLNKLLKRGGNSEEHERQQAEWRVGAARDLPITDDTSWDGDAAVAGVFRWAGFDTDELDPERARQAFLVYDANAPELMGSYKLPFARVTDGELQASRRGLTAANQRLGQTDVPVDVRDRAQDVITSYQERMNGEGRSFIVTRDVDGVPYWIAFSASAFLARDGRFISTEALRDYVERDIPDRGPLYMMHHPELVIGDCRASFLAGRLLVETGTFRSTPLARAAIKYYENTDEKLGVSIRWATPDDKLNNDTYEEIHVIERSELPLSMAADVTTEFTYGERSMNDVQDRIKLLVPELVEDEALRKSVLAKIDEGVELSTIFEDLGLPYRAANEEQEDEADEHEEQHEEERQEDAEEMVEETVADEAPALTREMMQQMLDEAFTTFLATMGEELGRVKDEMVSLRADLDAVQERTEKQQREEDMRAMFVQALNNAAGERASESEETMARWNPQSAGGEHDRPIMSQVVRKTNKQRRWHD